MTEAAHQMCSNGLPPRQRKPGSVGRPARVDVAIMDDAGALLAIGVEGEVVIRGRNVTLGYDNNPEANRVFFSDGWSRTGDRGRFDIDGDLFLTGRIRELISRGGGKIVPREIDEVLLSHSAVAQALTFAVPDPVLGERVAAAVVLKPRFSLTDGICSSIRRNLLPTSKFQKRLSSLLKSQRAPRVSRSALDSRRNWGSPAWADLCAAVLPNIARRTQRPKHAWLRCGLRFSNLIAQGLTMTSLRREGIRYLPPNSWCAYGSDSAWNSPCRICSGCQQLQRSRIRSMRSRAARQPAPTSRP